MPTLQENSENNNIIINKLPSSTGYLKNYEVYYEDENPTSEFFQIQKFPEVLTSGKNSFLITGTKLLKSNTKVLIEVLDYENNRIPISIPDILVNGSDRIVIINIEEGVVPYGVGSVSIVGQANDVPREWQSTYNIRWTREILINPALPNENFVLFEKNPELYVSELYDNTGVISKKIYEDKIYSQGQIYSKLGKQSAEQVFRNYYIYLQDGPLLTENPLFDGTSGWDTSSAYISDILVEDESIAFSQSYGGGGITQGVTQEFYMSANVIYTTFATFYGQNSNLNDSTASIYIKSGSNIIVSQSTNLEEETYFEFQFSSSTDITGTLEFGGVDNTLNTKWGNVYVTNLISGSNGNGFNKNMEGYKLYMNEDDVNIYPDPDSYTVSGTYEGVIYKVINPQTLLLTNSYTAYNINTQNFQRVQFRSSSYEIHYDKEYQEELDNTRNSYLKLHVKNIKTISGRLKEIELYKNPGNQFLGKYPLETDNYLENGGEFNDVNDFNNNWTYIESGSYSLLVGGGGGKNVTL